MLRMILIEFCCNVDLFFCLYNSAGDELASINLRRLATSLWALWNSQVMERGMRGLACPSMVCAFQMFHQLKGIKI